MKRIMFLGRGPIAERCLEILLRGADESYSIAAICSNPTTNVWWKSNKIFMEANRLCIPFISNEKRNDDIILASIGSEAVDYLISIQHIWILPEDALRAVRYRALNLHNAKLPNYKGYFTINHAIVNDESTYTSTIHWMAKEVDEGAIAFEETLPITRDDTAISLYRKSCDSGVKAFQKLVECLASDVEPPRLNLNGRGHFYRKSDLEMLREINNPADASEVDRKSRGLFFPPFEPAFYRVHGKKIYVLPKSYTDYVDDNFIRQFDTAQECSGYIVAPISR